MYAFRSLQLKITLGDFFFSCALEIQLLNSWLLDKRCCSHNGNSTRWTLHIQHIQKNSFTFVSQSSHTVKMPHQLFAKKANVFIVNIHNGTFCHSSLADCYYWGCHRCHAIAVLIKHWKCLRFFSHSHFNLPFMFFFATFCCVAKACKKHWIKRIVTVLNCTLPQSFRVLFKFRCIRWAFEIEYSKWITTNEKK